MGWLWTKFKTEGETVTLSCSYESDSEYVRLYWYRQYHLHLSDAFIQSDLQLHSGYTFSLVHVFPGNRTHNLLRNRRNALPLSHTGTQNSKQKERL